MRSARMLTVTAALAASALALAACSSAESATSESAGATAAGGDLRMTVWTSNEDHLALFNGIADKYIAENPDVTSITFDPLPFDDYTTTLMTQIAGGDAPDLAWIFETTAPDFVQSEALLGLNETLQNTEGYDVEDVSPAATELWLNGDELRAYPFSTSPFVMFANDDLLAEAGLPSAAEMQAAGDWNWDAISKAGAEVNAKTGKAGFVIRDFEYTNWDGLSSIWTGWGAAPWSADGSTCTFTSPEMVEAFTFIHDAAFTSKSMPGPGTTADFFAGESAFTVTQISRASLLADAAYNWDLLPLPAGPAGDFSIVGQAGIGVVQQGKDPQTAADFLAYFTNPENSALLAQYFPPPRTSLLNAETLAAANPILTAEQLETVVVPAITNGSVRPPITNAARVNQTVRAALDAMWVPEADVPAVLAGVCEALDPLLAS